MRRPIAVLTVGLALGACGRSSSSTAPAAARDAAPPAPPPPARPAGLLLEAHFGQPRATATALGQLMGSRLPLELGLALSLGISSTVLSAADLTRPLDVVVAGTAEQPHVVWVFTPGAQNLLRSTLAARYRLTPVPGLGDQLEPRTPGAARSREAHCALVHVPGPAERIVCSQQPEGLAYAGRYAAYAAQQRAEETGDGWMELDGAAARTVLWPRVRRSVEALAQELAGSAATARREHVRPPDFGDPEAVVAMVQRFAGDLDAQMADVTRLTVRATVGEQLTLESTLALDARGHSALVHDALARVGTGSGHPLARRLAPDSFALFASHATPEAHAALLTWASEALLQVLGARVPNAAAARADLAALFARVGDGVVLGHARAQGDQDEQTVIFSLTDDGTEARAALTRLARAPWLRGLRVGDAAVNVSSRNHSLLLRLQPASGARTRGAVETAPALALAVVDNALVLVTGAHPETTLAALGPRAEGPAPSLLAQMPEGALAGALDLGAVRGAPGERAVVSFVYGATREGEQVIGRGRITVPGRVGAALSRGMMRSVMRGVREPQ
jgi:hypothetical protein